MTERHPAEPDNATRLAGIVLILATLAAALPFEVIQLSDEVRFPLSDLVPVLGVLALFRIQLSGSLVLLLAAFAAALVSVMVVAITVDMKPRAAMSWAYFTKPHFALFAGVLAAQQPNAIRTFLRIWSLAFGLFCLATGVVVVQEVDRLREGYSLLGIPVFGVAGANAYAVFLALGGMLAVVLVERADIRMAERLWAGSVAIIAFALVIVSLSRQSALAVLIFSAIIALRMVVKHPMHGITSGSIVVAAAVLLVVSGAVDLERWTDRLKWTAEGIDNADAELLTSGRTEIWRGMLYSISTSPVFGTGFLGWAFPTENWQQAAWLEQGLSPHNQWLGTLWRMGLLPGAVYFAAILAISARALIFTESGAAPWTIRIILLLVLTLFCMTQDVLTYPLSGNLVFFLLGLLCGSASAKPAFGGPELSTQRNSRA